MKTSVAALGNREYGLASRTCKPGLPSPPRVREAGPGCAGFCLQSPHVCKLLSSPRAGEQTWQWAWEVTISLTGGADSSVGARGAPRGQWCCQLTPSWSLPSPLCLYLPLRAGHTVTSERCTGRPRPRLCPGCHGHGSGSDSHRRGAGCRAEGPSARLRTAAGPSSLSLWLSHFERARAPLAGSAVCVEGPWLRGRLRAQP